MWWRITQVYLSISEKIKDLCMQWFSYRFNRLWVRRRVRLEGTKSSAITFVSRKSTSCKYQVPRPKIFWFFHFFFCEDVHVIWPISFGWVATARYKDPVVLRFLSHAKEAFRVLLKHNLDFYEVVHKAAVWCSLKHLLVHLLWYFCIIHGGSWVEFLSWWWAEIVE